MTLYPYVGPPDIAKARFDTARFRIEVAADALRWAQTQVAGKDEPLTATFIVDKSGALWLADRRSEHIACSRGEAVQAAGELRFEFHPSTVQVSEATNQSTGFCPPVESWTALEGALNRAGIVHPRAWTSAFEFRRCPSCGATNIVKDEWFRCAVCDAPLPEKWNLA